MPIDVTVSRSVVPLFQRTDSRMQASVYCLLAFFLFGVFVCCFLAWCFLSRVSFDWFFVCSVLLCLVLLSSGVCLFLVLVLSRGFSWCFMFVFFVRCFLDVFFAWCFLPETAKSNRTSAQRIARTGECSSYIAESNSPVAKHRL